jgi:hypothetical protein
MTDQIIMVVPLLPRLMAMATHHRQTTQDHLLLLIIHTSQEVVRVITTVLFLLLTTAAHHRCLHLSNILTIMESTHVVELIPPQEEAVAVVTIKFNSIHSRRIAVMMDKMMKTMTII